MTSLVTWLCSQVRFCSPWRNSFVIEKAVNVVWSTMVWAILDCPGTEQNIHIKGAIYNFQKVGVSVQVVSRVALNERKQKNWIFVDIVMKYTFLSFLMLWRCKFSSSTKHDIWRLKTYRKQWRNKWLLYFQPELKASPSFARMSKLYFILSMN